MAFIHIAKGTRRPGAFNVPTLCGRLTNFMTGTGSPEDATCTRCLAEHLVRESAQYAGE